MWAVLESDGSSRVQTVEEGVERVLSSTDEHPWVFLSESASFQYVAAQRCDVEVIVVDFVLRPLALAVPIRSSYLDRLSLAILEESEEGEIEKLRRKWWYRHVDCEHSPHSGGSRRGLGWA